MEDTEELTVLGLNYRTDGLRTIVRASDEKTAKTVRRIRELRLAFRDAKATTKMIEQAVGSAQHVAYTTENKVGVRILNYLNE